MELQAALRCFENNKEYEPIDAYVPRFDYVLPRVANPGRQIYPLWEIVHDLWVACPYIFQPQSKFHKAQTLAISMDRARPRRSKMPVPPLETIREILIQRMSVTPERATEVASWIRAHPSRCPGLWLVREVGYAMSQNVSYSVRQDDTFDMAEIMSFPYVEAATVDRTMFHYLSSAMHKLSRAGALADAPRVFRNLRDVMKAWV